MNCYIVYSSNIQKNGNNHGEKNNWDQKGILSWNILISKAYLTWEKSFKLL